MLANGVAQDCALANIFYNASEELCLLTFVVKLAEFYNNTMI